ncbi:aminotransferase class V-fold PLP-dependent enzyme [Nonomuraea rhodomycinica]|uniref:Aminotransferase class V-fold PLP-dependent enzyme n=1 Tax=Nonomuraea rhodomycinica TaxID=1712872 RepID=A0A7Y6IZI9_9ACTN|nr:aminotransferase class V-fold PLP-dependent enzyme [Nonomuraea rhodomycinica]NUW46793.1 aminotransferase class V-fold PLP-dependent enzyme [Nonomuraea rhodomycinica]
MPPLARQHFPTTRSWAYLNHAGICPLPQPAVDAMLRRAQEASVDGEFTYEQHKSDNERIRALGARLMGVPADDVAFIKNTTEGLGFVANGLSWSPGDRVVIPDGEFPSTLYPWLALQDQGVRIDRVAPAGPGGALPVEAFERVIRQGPPPKVVVTSWVQFGTGWRVELPALAEVCADVGALLCADVIQGLGVVPADLDRWGVDFAMADGHKWLLGPTGSGLLYVRGRHLDRLRPLEPGWNAVRHREDWDNPHLVYDPTARRLEGGMPIMSGIAALGASLGLLLEAGVEAVWRHVDALCEHACEGLTKAGAVILSDRSAAARSGIVSFSLDGLDAPAAALELRMRGIACSARSGALRISPHGYNTFEEIDRLVAEVRRLAGSPR